MPLRVLVVDDSFAMRRLVKRQVLASGAPVEECTDAANGLDALEKLGAQPFDIVVTDINMPTMDGLELARGMRADERLKHIPVIVVSSDSASERFAEFRPLGAVGFVQKPFTPQALRQEMERLLDLAGIVVRARREADAVEA